METGRERVQRTGIPNEKERKRMAQINPMLFGFILRAAITQAHAVERVCDSLGSVTSAPFFFVRLNRFHILYLPAATCAKLNLNESFSSQFADEYVNGSGQLVPIQRYSVRWINFKQQITDYENCAGPQIEPKRPEITIILVRQRYRGVHSA